MIKESLSITTLASGDNTTRLLLEGQLIIRNGNAIKSELILALNSSQNLELAFKNIIKVDLAVLQLLIALQKSAARLDKNLSFDIELTDATKLVIQNSGLEKILITDFKRQVNGIH